MGKDGKTPNQRIKLYPNPTSGIMQIESKCPIREIKVVNISGKRVYHELSPANRMLDLTEMANGLYVIQIKTERDVFTKRILKR